jgi:hypothetical protein
MLLFRLDWKGPPDCGCNHYCENDSEEDAHGCFPLSAPREPLALNCYKQINRTLLASLCWTSQKRMVCGVMRLYVSIRYPAGSLSRVKHTSTLLVDVHMKS